MSVKEGSLGAPARLHQGVHLINPLWARALSVSGERRRVTLILQGERIVLELIGATTVGIVRSHHTCRDLRPNDVIWVKEMKVDGVTIHNFQFFPEGLPGATRATERITLVEKAKSNVLARGATGLISSLNDLLEASDDNELGLLFQPHLTLIEFFINGRPETVEQLKHENPRKVRRMLERCLTLQDATGRRNPHSKVLGVKSSVKRLHAMSTRRMETANTALTTSITLNTLINAMHALVVEVDAEVQSKLNANTWDMNNATHRRWLKRFAARCTTWANEFGNMNMHPFNRSAAEAEQHLSHAATLMQDGLETSVPQIQSELRRVIIATKTLIARFRVAEMLRVVGTARDERVRKLGLEVANPVWTEINLGLQEARETFGIESRLTSVIPDPAMDGRIPFYYQALRDTARFHDTASRNAA